MTKKIVVFKMDTAEQTAEIIDKLFACLNQSRINCLAAAQLITRGDADIALVGLLTTADDILACFLELNSDGKSDPPKPTPVKGSTSLH